MFIPIHSIVDLITNSSTEIFVSFKKDSVKVIKDLIQEIIKSTGSDKKVDDLFTVTLCTTEMPSVDSDMDINTTVGPCYEVPCYVCDETGVSGIGDVLCERCKGDGLILMEELTLEESTNDYYLKYFKSFEDDIPFGVSIKPKNEEGKDLGKAITNLLELKTRSC